MAPRTVICALVLGLVMVIGVAGCGDRDDPSASTVVTEAASASTTVASTTPTTGGAVTETIHTSTTALPPTTGVTLRDLSGLMPELGEEVHAVDLSSVALVISAQEDLYAYLFATESLVELPVENDVYVGGVDIAGDLVVWTENTYSNDLNGPLQASLYAYRLPDGPKVKLVGDSRGPWAPLIDGGRVFWVETTHVSGDPGQGEQSLDQCAIWMIEVDGDGKPQGSPIKVTDRPNSNHEPAGDELWSYDVHGSHLAYQRMWGEEPGVHLLDLGGGTDTYLGEGDIPSLSSSLVAWRGTAEDGGWQVWGYDLETGLVAVLAEDGHMPFAGPGYVLYARHDGDDPTHNDLLLLDEETGSTTRLGEAGQSGGNPFISITGSADHVAWVTVTDEGDRKVRLVTMPALGVASGSVRDIWEGASTPPILAE